MVPVDVTSLTEHRPIATLAHKLDRVLFKSVNPFPYCLAVSFDFSPGVHWLQEPRSGVYNFTPWLQNIPDVNEFAFERLPPFVKSSRDNVRDIDCLFGLRATNVRFQDLWELAKRERRIFGGSTSSLTGMLSQVYFLISGFRTPDTSLLSRPFQYMVRTFHDFAVGFARLTTRKARRFHSWSTDAGRSPFELQRWDVRNRLGPW